MRSSRSQRLLLPAKLALFSAMPVRLLSRVRVLLLISLNNRGYFVLLQALTVMMEMMLHWVIIFSMSYVFPFLLVFDEFEGALLQGILG
jgi:hypothetical protein